MKKKTHLPHIKHSQYIIIYHIMGVFNIGGGVFILIREGDYPLALTLIMITQSSLSHEDVSPPKIEALSLRIIPSHVLPTLVYLSAFLPTMSLDD